MSGRRRPPLIVVLFFAIDCALVGAYAVLYLTRVGRGPLFHLFDLNGEAVPYLARVIRGPLFQLFDLNREVSVPTWYSSMQLFCIAALLGLFALRNLDRSRKASWALLLCPLFFLAASLDETAAIHERFGILLDRFLLSGEDREATFFRETGTWMFTLGIPVLLAGLAVLFTLREYFSSPTLIKKALIGFGIFFGGAIGIETLSNIPNRGTLAYIIETCFEELFEMVGATVLLWATLDLMSAHGFAMHLKPVNERTETPDDPSAVGRSPAR